MSSSLLLTRPTLFDLPAVPELPAGYALRLAGLGDEPALAATLTAAFEPTAIYRQDWDVNRVRRELLDAGDVDATLVATWQRDVVATVSSRYLPDRYPEAGYVHWVGTDPAHARRGLAGALLIELLGHFGRLGRSNAVLETDDHRHSAIRSYLRLGFTPTYEVGAENHRQRWSTIFQQLYR